jgi:5-methyltetrahydropteroyltriglutamate--homocysteine methyltransferase
MVSECRSEHVGSLLRPPELLRARAARERGEITTEQLREVEDRAVLDAIALQRAAGLEVVTDGEMRRENWLASVMETVGGLVPVDRDQAFPTRWHRDADGTPPTEETDLPPVVVGERLYRKESQSRVEAEFLAASAGGPFKLTMASPTMGIIVWGPGVSDRVYGSPDEVIEALLELQLQDVPTLLDAGVSWLQLDSLAYIPVIDPALAADGAQLKGILDRTIRVDNTLIRAARANRPDLTVAMHFCRGNNRSAWAAQGSYEPIAERVFGEVEVDRFLLEYDTERAGGFEPLRFVPPGKTAVLGLVTTKVPTLEPRDELLRRIDQAAKYLPLEQLALTTQCGFASTSKGNLLSVDDQRRKLDLVVETAQAVWG